MEPNDTSEIIYLMQILICGAFVYLMYKYLKPTIYELYRMTPKEKDFFPLLGEVFLLAVGIGVAGYHLYAGIDQLIA